MKHAFLALASAPLALGLIAATPVTAQDAAEPINSPGLPEDLQPIDDVLPGGLVNDPTRLDWDTYGANLSREMVTDASIPAGGVAMRYEMTERGAIYAGGANIPLLVPVEDGTRITVGFYARTIEAGTTDGTGRVGVRFQLNRDPYPGYGDTVLNIGSEWAFYEVTTVANRDLNNDGIVALQFGLARQTVEIGQAIVVTGTRSVTG